MSIANAGPCEVDGCAKPMKSRVSGMCGMHIERMRARGTTEPTLATRYPRCAADGCPKGSGDQTGLCRLHRRRQMAGIPLDAPPNNKGGTFERQIAKVESGCWEWTGCTSHGYGIYDSGNAHRESYRRYVGPIPEGLVIDHLCRNTLCVNPMHLEAVTYQINMLRGIAPAAIVVQMNRCMKGHELTGDNVYHRPDGRGRQCVTCNRVRQRARWHRNRRDVAS